MGLKLSQLSSIYYHHSFVFNHSVDLKWLSTKVQHNKTFKMLQSVKLSISVPTWRWFNQNDVDSMYSYASIIKDMKRANIQLSIQIYYLFCCFSFLIVIFISVLHQGEKKGHLSAFNHQWNISILSLFICP